MSYERRPQLENHVPIFCGGDGDRWDCLNHHDYKATILAQGPEYDVQDYGAHVCRLDAAAVLVYDTPWDVAITQF